MLIPYEAKITDDHQYGFQRNGSNVGDFFAIRQLRMNGKTYIYVP